MSYPPNLARALIRPKRQIQPASRTVRPRMLVGVIALVLSAPLIGCGSSASSPSSELRTQARTLVTALKDGDFKKACSVMAPVLWHSLQYTRVNAQGYGEFVHSGPCVVRLEHVRRDLPGDLRLNEFDSLVSRMRVIPHVEATYGSLEVALWEAGAWRFARPPWSLGPAYQPR